MVARHGHDLDARPREPLDAPLEVPIGLDLVPVVVHDVPGQHDGDDPLVERELHGPGPGLHRGQRAGGRPHPGQPLWLPPQVDVSDEEQLGDHRAPTLPPPTGAGAKLRPPGHPQHPRVTVAARRS